MREYFQLPLGFSIEKQFIKNIPDDLTLSGELSPYTQSGSSDYFVIYFKGFIYVFFDFKNRTSGGALVAFDAYWNPVDRWDIEQISSICSVKIELLRKRIYVEDQFSDVLIIPFDKIEIKSNASTIADWHFMVLASISGISISSMN